MVIFGAEHAVVAPPLVPEHVHCHCVLDDVTALGRLGDSQRLARGAVAVGTSRAVPQAPSPGPTAVGVTIADALDGGLTSEAEFIAVTVHVYDFPLVRLDTTIGLAALRVAPIAPPSPDVHLAE